MHIDCDLYSEAISFVTLLTTRTAAHHTVCAQWLQRRRVSFRREMHGGRRQNTYWVFWKHLYYTIKTPRIRAAKMGRLSRHWTSHHWTSHVSWPVAEWVMSQWMSHVSWHVTWLDESCLMTCHMTKWVIIERVMSRDVSLNESCLETVEYIQRVNIAHDMSLNESCLLTWSCPIEWVMSLDMSRDWMSHVSWHVPWLNESCLPRSRLL